MKYVPHVVVILLCAFTLLWRIEGTLLWRDEATTANWARMMVEHKLLVPRVFDGKRLVAQAADSHDFDDRFLPVMQGWLQFYVAALSFWIAGPGTLSARLPFVLAGALALWALYRLGKELFPGSLAALAAPVAGATSIYFLTAARQARYYALVVLFTACILLEFCRYLQDSSRARRWGFYLRLGFYGLLVYLANYVSFGGLWISLTVFVLLTEDHALIRRFLILSAVLAVPLAAEFLLVHSQFVRSTAVAQPAHWRDYAEAFRDHGVEMFRMIPLAAMLPAAWYVFWRRRDSRSPAVRGVALLAACVVVISVVATVAVARDSALPRYYFQILPPLLLLVGILAKRLWDLAGPAWAAAFFLFAIAWPNLNFYNGWCEDAVERQLVRDHTTNEPIVNFLVRHVPHDETVAFYRNVQGMMAYFDLPWLQWVDLLDSDEPRNQRRRAILPAYVFDDWDGADWYVVWDTHDKAPKKLTANYQLVWTYTYKDPQSWWDRHEPARVLSYRVYRRAASAAAAGAWTRK
ncbi:MAG TPA: glycosyltransferase family 39 protein [Bryobacterales bacterium]|nr:glycosyltransferase family 39 protein [Bryobacterales bacterium]